MRHLLTVFLILFFSRVVAAPVPQALSERFDQLLSETEDGYTREKLSDARADVLLALNAWCSRQDECQPELISITDLESLTSILLSARGDEIRLNALIITELAAIQDDRRYLLLQSHQSELVKDFKRYCELNITCYIDSLTDEQVRRFLKVWTPSEKDAEAQVVDSESAHDSLPPELPQPYWECSAFENNKDNSIRYGWLYWRDVRVFLNPEVARREQGPLVFYWHGSNETWEQIYRVLGSSVMQQIMDEGGIIVAPHAGAPEALPWYVMNPATAMLENDFYLADQLVACSEQLYDINERRIYSMGFSAGGIMSTAMGRYRSNYIASIASYSGGQLPWYAVTFSQQPANYYNAFITYGTPGKDIVPKVEFAATSESFINYLEWRGFHRVKVCQEKRGHSMPYSTMQKGWDWIKNTRFRELYPSDVENFQEADVRYNGVGC
ncbi:hypothetical protein EOPP23_15355 [Endozoicomonas sp. OPT23]|uniref:hypothetical protein n=1 Tax=Endozoicomonas sp. OPT23 TaxID=2072845 RepID=UPI00129B29D1|nr:hypothetical protein [Endozoicomonas sp. OPT23]MRI34365.1 hypothetical protein [Endozoicomonas sp. OPT23]